MRTLWKQWIEIRNPLLRRVQWYCHSLYAEGHLQNIKLVFTDKDGEYIRYYKDNAEWATYDWGRFVYQGVGTTDLRNEKEQGEG